jgi:hypothetical protein
MENFFSFPCSKSRDFPDGRPTRRSLKYFYVSCSTDEPALAMAKQS